jgi:hypothetical protein
MEVGETKVAYSERPLSKSFCNKNKLEKNRRKIQQGTKPVTILVDTKYPQQ